MDEHKFLRRIYWYGINETTGADRRAFTQARECYLLARDLQRTMPERSRLLANRGLLALAMIKQDLSELEGYNLLLGALQAQAKEPVR